PILQSPVAREPPYSHPPMILTCPECSTAYFVDEAKIPAEGRMVKCAQCGHRWTAYATPAEPEPDLEPEIELGADLMASEAMLEDAEPDTGDLAAADLPKVFRAKAADHRKVREAATTGVVWAGMAAALVVLIAVAAVFRVSVVGLWPKTAAAYAWVGLPVNSLGLTIEGVRAEPALQEGHAALSVSGMFRNVKDKPITAPPLRISLLNKSGKRLSTKIAQPADAVVPPGETRHFAIAILDPPTTASQLEVAFAPEAAHKRESLPKAARVATPHAPEAPTLRDGQAPEPVAIPGPPPVEAQPLPSSSPYALEPHG
ncbi:MAG TPA: DUF3426 domain-containing protein, partial [Phenylobacterium sp.]|nr:DUF3426 domain-containing protein [Phenylobacterium sp.]